MVILEREKKPCNHGSFPPEPQHPNLVNQAPGFPCRRASRMHLFQTRRLHAGSSLSRPQDISKSDAGFSLSLDVGI